MGRAFGVVALIFGVISIPFGGAMAAIGSLTFLASDTASIVSILGWLIPGIAIVFGIIGIIADDSKGLAIAGFLLGIIGLIVGFLVRSLIANFFEFLP